MFVEWIIPSVRNMVNSLFWWWKPMRRKHSGHVIPNILSFAVSSRKSPNFFIEPQLWSVQLSWALLALTRLVLRITQVPVTKTSFWNTPTQLWAAVCNLGTCGLEQLWTTTSHTLRKAPLLEFSFLPIWMIQHVSNVSRHQKCVQTTTLSHVVQASWYHLLIQVGIGEDLPQSCYDQPNGSGHLATDPAHLLCCSPSSLGHSPPNSQELCCPQGLSLLPGDTTPACGLGSEALLKTLDAYLLYYAGHFLLVFLKLV